MENNELYGTLVLVHPDLKNDPAGQQGKVGILSYIDSSDEIYVGFENGREGKYSPDALMSLKDKSEIFPDLASTTWAITPDPSSRGPLAVVFDGVAASALETPVRRFRPPAAATPVAAAPMDAFLRK